MRANAASSSSVFQPSILRWSYIESRSQRLARNSVRLALTGCLCAMAAGCFPGDGEKTGETKPSLSFPVSNIASKTDRWDVLSESRSKDAAIEDYRIATTATVVPTSASAETTTSVREPFPTVTGVPASKALRKFYDALAALDGGDRSKPVTILHLGDGHIAADRFTSTLRARFQARFGDAGRGMMAPGLFRVAEADITRNGNWTAASSAAGDPGPFGLAGVRLTGRKGATLELAMSKSPFEWAEITFATTPDTGRVHVEVDGKGDTVGTSTMKPSWQRIRINAGGAKLKLRVEDGGPVHILSVVVGKDAPGLRYVNLGVPKATALTPKRWDDEILAAELAHSAPDLVLLGYGTNEAFDHQLDAREYANEFANLVHLLKKRAPNASFVVIGPPDVSHMPAFASSDSANACRPLSDTERAHYARLRREQNPRLGRWHPPLKLHAVRWSARRAASMAGAYFWDWSKMMGGPCSIHAWVHTQPPLASASHRHFTPAGARHSAEALFRDLLSGYESYRSSAAQAER